LCALLRDGRDAALPPTRTGQHLEAAVSSCRRVQPKPGPAQVAGCGHAARVEKPPWHAHFASLFAALASECSPPVLSKPHLRGRSQALCKIADPAMPHALVCSSTCDWREAVAVLSAWLRKSSSDRISREIWVSSRPEVRLQSAFCSNVWNSANRTMSWSPSQIMIRADPMPPICSVL